MSSLRNWWADFFWSRADKAGAAFRRGFALGFVAALIAVSILERL